MRRKLELEERLEGDAEPPHELLPCPRAGIRALTVDELGEMAAVEPQPESPGVLALTASSK